MSNTVTLILEPLGVETAVVERAIAEATDTQPVWGTLEEVDPATVRYLVTVKTPVTSALIAQLPNLHAVAVAFTGYDAVDLAACRARNISVMNVPEYATTAVAELVVCLSLNLVRDIPAATATMVDGGWGMPPGGELSGKTVGIVGTGAIGTATAARFAAFGCTVLGWSRSERAAFAAYGSYVTDLKALIAQVDILSLHVPLSDRTTGLIGAAELAELRPEAFLINTARGPVVDEAALIAALDARAFRAAALDVFATEPLPAEHPLRTHPRVLATPHISFNTGPALKERLAVTCANLAAAHSGVPRNVVT
jgi:D-3-phosphoglycerate dehydrogenase